MFRNLGARVAATKAALCAAASIVLFWGVHASAASTLLWSGTVEPGEYGFYSGWGDISAPVGRIDLTLVTSQPVAASIYVAGHYRYEADLDDPRGGHFGYDFDRSAPEFSSRTHPYGMFARYTNPGETAVHLDCCYPGMPPWLWELGEDGTWDPAYTEYEMWELWIYVSGDLIDPSKRTTFALYGSPAPEPATWAMMIVGFGLAGSGLRRARPRLLTA